VEEASMLKYVVSSDSHVWLYKLETPVSRFHGFKEPYDCFQGAIFGVICLLRKK
jgi:hypothetical protein